MFTDAEKFKGATRLFFLAPAITFALGAAFIGSSFALGVAPDNPSIWHAFLTLAPLTREPVNLVDSIPGVGYGLNFLFFSIVATACAIMAFTSWGSDRARYLTAHLSLFTVVFSMGHVSKTYSSIGETDPLTLWGRISHNIAFPSPSYVLLALTTLVGIACLLTHAKIIVGIIQQYKARTALDRQIGELSAAFSR